MDSKMIFDIYVVKNPKMIEDNDLWSCSSSEYNNSNRIAMVTSNSNETIFEFKYENVVSILIETTMVEMS